MKIVTLTLNPAFDMHCFIKTFCPYRENIAEIQSSDAGGKGVNISRALSANGVENLAVIIAGGENSDEFERKLKADKLNYKLVKTAGRIRENITIHSDGEKETRVSFNGFKCDKSLLQQVSEDIGAADSDMVITLTGSVPDGLTASDVKAFLEEFRLRGAKIVIDSRSFSLKDLTDFKPWLIKPNEFEAGAYLKTEIKTPKDGILAAKKLQATGIENVLLSLGDKGAVLATDNGAYFAAAPKISAVSTIGAGDSMIAGFLSAFADKKSDRERLRRAAAFGTAACLRAGTLPPLPKDVGFLEKQIAPEVY